MPSNAAEIKKDAGELFERFTDAIQAREKCDRNRAYALAVEEPLGKSIMQIHDDAQAIEVGGVTSFEICKLHTA